MTKRSTAGLAAVAWLFGSLACAGGMAREDDTAAAQQDTTEAAAQDTTEAAEPPPGYSGMEQDTTGEEPQPTAVDTFLNEQGTGQPTDTAGYGGLEQPDTSAAAAGDTGMAAPADTGMAAPADTGMAAPADTGMVPPADTGMVPADTGMMDTTSTTGVDTTGQY
jgi:hypothetical protein